MRSFQDYRYRSLSPNCNINKVQIFLDLQWRIHPDKPIVSRKYPKSKMHLIHFNLLNIIAQPAAAAAKSLQSCLTLCDPIDGSPPGSAAPGTLQARTLEYNWAKTSNTRLFYNKMLNTSRSLLNMAVVQSLSRVQLFPTPWTVVCHSSIHGFPR